MGLQYPSIYATLPVHMNHSYHNSLGIQVHSLIHKPSHGLVASSGYNSVHRPAMDHQPSVGKLSEHNLTVAPDNVTESYWPMGGAVRLMAHQDNLEKLDLSLKL